MEINLLTKKLLAKGFTKENPPDWVRPWRDFYGGWTYPVEMLYNMVYETPCGLLTKGCGVHGHMSYGGIDWTVENDCYTIACPKFDGIICELNHPVLRDSFLLRENICSCAVKQTDRPYDYEHSLEKAHKEVWAEADRLFEEFDSKMGGRACKYRSSYDRHTKKWQMFYDPMKCARAPIPACQEFCKVLQKPLLGKKGNVFYDVKHTQVEKGVGLFPDEKRVYVTKGIKLLERSVSITLCEAIIEHSASSIAKRYIDKEVYNFRCEFRAGRNLLQDLADAAEGIEVHHAAVDKKIAAEQKRQRKEARKQKRILRLEKLILQHGFYNLEEIDKRRAEKHLGERIYELDDEHHKPPESEFEQLTF